MKIVLKRTYHQIGLTLMEILITMAVIASVLLTLAVVVGNSLSTVQESKAESVSIFIAESIHSRLMTDPEWPPGSADQSFSRNVDEFGMPKDSFVFDDLFFDSEGTELERKTNRAVYQGVLTFSRSANYESRRLDFISFELKRLKNPGAPPITFSFQRARRTPRSSASS